MNKEYSMPSVLITGGAGFIGSNIAAAIAARSTHRVIVCDRLGADQRWRNLSKHVISEIVPPENLFYWLDMFGEDVEAIFHMGAISSTVETNVDLILDNNTTLSQMLWRYAIERQVPFIYASSAATYGDGALGFKDDASLAFLSQLRPLNPYAWSKQLFDLFVAQEVESGMPTPPQWAGLKFFNVYGPNEYHKDGQRSVASQMYDGLKRGENVKLFKSYRDTIADGEQKRDFIHVTDCVRIMLWLFDNPQISGLFNAGSGVARSFNDLAGALFAALGRPPAVDYTEMPESLRDKYQYFTEADMSKLLMAGYPYEITTLETGIADYVRNYLSRDDRYY